ELLVVLSLVVLTPLFEEIAFRGLIFGWARQRLGFVESALFSALVFAAFHSAYIDNLGPFWGLRAMAMIFTLGFLSALLFERTGSLIAPTALHALFNVQAVMPLLTEQPAA
ncbi:MAG: lysostaphin resistance A-like protein, partial [Alphaproteobacteria bacterium]